MQAYLSTTQQLVSESDKEALERFVWFDETRPGTQSVDERRAAVFRTFVLERFE